MGASRQYAVPRAARLCCLAFLGPARPGSARLSDSLVEVEDGKLRGQCDGHQGVCQYLGVPYAAAPIGGFRWRPPQPVFPWRGVRDAVEFKPMCLQVPFRLSRWVLQGNENCLFLNVWTPRAGCPGASCAVMFFIHGGGFIRGSGQGWNGSNLVAHAGDLVVVTINYRLGIMGFLATDELRWRDAERGSTGNYGIQDQRAALAWVQRNIHRFGGDAKNVMIFGSSAGGMSVGLHLVSQRSWPLYSKAAISSGSLSYVSVQTMAQAERQYEDLLNVTECTEGRLACLLNTSAEVVVNQSFKLPLRPRLYGGVGIAPAVDGVELDRLPWELMDEGRFNTKVPVLLGHTRDEGTYGVTNGLPHTRIFLKAFDMTAGDFVRLLTSARFSVDSEQLPRILDVYSVNSSGGEPNYSSWYWVAAHFSGDYEFTCPCRRMARALSRSSDSSVFAYYYAHTPLILPRATESGVRKPGTRNRTMPGTAGSSHGFDIPFFFLVRDGGRRAQRIAMRGDKEELLGKTLAGYLINFARNSDPNIPGRQGRPTRTDLTINWEPFTEARETSLRVGLPALSAALGRNDRQCDVVDGLGVLPFAVPPEVPGRREPPEKRWCLKSFVYT